MQPFNTLAEHGDGFEDDGCLLGHVRLQLLFQDVFEFEQCLFGEFFAR